MTDNTQQQAAELAEAIYAAEPWTNGSGCDAKPYVWSELDDEDKANFTPLASRILAAGYRKPQQVTTAGELDALPGGSIIRDAKGVAWQKYNRPLSDKPAWFPATRDDGFYFSSNLIDDERTPATVLHIGEKFK